MLMLQVASPGYQASPNASNLTATDVTVAVGERKISTINHTILGIEIGLPTNNI
jgi:hypothetical protein